VVGVNRIGEDGNKIKHSGDTLVLNPRGEIINHTLPNVDSIESTILSHQYLHDFRTLFPVMLDGDEFNIQSS
jgi:hypothetical protein